MSQTNRETVFFVGGTLVPDAPSYIPREADEQLLAAIRSGEYCTMLTTRQIGKSSLMARTAVELRKEGIGCAFIDLQGKGHQDGRWARISRWFTGRKSLDPEQWYFSFLTEAARGLNLDVNLKEWWQGSNVLPAQKMADFFLDLVLHSKEGQIVIFVDEIDWMIRLPFSDEFFATIRSCRNRGAFDNEARRLTFVLAGSALPSQLIKDSTRTPFNIGYEIELKDFTLKQTETLGRFLGVRGNDLLSRIHYWTDGHPYLTQLLCKAAEPMASTDHPSDLIDRLVEEKLCSPVARKIENNLKLVEDRISAIKKRRQALIVYKDLLLGKDVPDKPASRVHSSLRLSGLTKPDSSRSLQIRNRVYRTVFDLKWVKAKMPPDPIPIALTILAAAMLSTVVWYLKVLPKQYFEVLEDPNSSIANIERAYTTLDKPFLRNRANDLFARVYQSRGERDPVTLILAHAGRPRQLKDLAGDDYQRLYRTIHHGGPVFSVVFSHDGRRLATGDGQNWAKVFDASSGKQVLGVNHEGPVTSLAFSPDDDFLVTASEDGTSRMVSIRSGKEVWRSPQTAALRSVAFSPDAKFVANGGENHAVHVYNSVTGAEVWHRTYRDNVYSVRFSPDSKLLAVGAWDYGDQILDASSGAPNLNFPKRKNWVNTVDFCADGKSLVAATWDHTARIFSTVDGRAPTKLFSKGIVFTAKFNPNGHTVATGSWDHTARLFNAVTGREIFSFPHNGPVYDVDFSSDGKLLATASWDRTARIFNLATGREIARFVHGAAVYAVKFSPDRKFLATGSLDRATRLFKLEFDLSVEDAKQTSTPHASEIIESVAFNRNGNLLGTGTREKMALVTDVQTGQAVGTFKNQGIVEAVAFSPNGGLFAAGSWDNAVHLFELSSGRELHTLKHNGIVETLVFSSDGRYLASGSADSKARIFDVQTGEEICRPLPHQGVVDAVAFSENGRFVATGSLDKTARVFEIPSGREVSKLAHQGLVFAVALSPDGRTAASASLDRTLRFFKASTGDEISRLTIPEIVDPVPNFLLVKATPKGAHAVGSLAFSRDGHLLAGSFGDWLLLYELRVDRWFPKAARFMPILLPNTLRFKTGNDAHVYVQVARDAPDSPPQLMTIDFDETMLPDSGNNKGLLAVWTGRLGLTMDSAGKILPVGVGSTH